MKARKRKKGSGIRIYIDQLEALALLAAGKYGGRKSVKDLVREAVDEFLEQKNPSSLYKSQSRTYL
jgi:hypothetical protein